MKFFQYYILYPSAVAIFIWVSLMLSILIQELGHMIGWKDIRFRVSYGN